MAGSLFDKMDGLIQGVRHFALGITLAMVSIFVLFFAGMTVIRLFGLCWRLLFSRPFGV